MKFCARLLQKDICRASYRRKERPAALPQGYIDLTGLSTVDFESVVGLSNVEKENTADYVFPGNGSFDPFYEESRQSAAFSEIKDINSG